MVHEWLRCPLNREKLIFYQYNYHKLQWKDVYGRITLLICNNQWGEGIPSKKSTKIETEQLDRVSLKKNFIKSKQLTRWAVPGIQENCKQGRES